MKIPSQEYRLHLFERYAVPTTIQRHCRKVAEVGVFLARRLRDARVEIDVELVVAGCVLSDAVKVA